MVGKKRLRQSRRDYVGEHCLEYGKVGSITIFGSIILGLLRFCRSEFFASARTVDIVGFRLSGRPGRAAVCDW